MTATPLLFQEGDSLLIRGSSAERVLWNVVARKRAGYLMQPFGGGDARTWTDEELARAHLERRLTHYPFDVNGLPRSYAEVVDRTWEAWPKAVRRAAERRHLYVQMVDVLRGDYPTMLATYAAAGRIVFEANQSAWAAEDLEAAAEQTGERNARARNVESDAVAETKATAAPSAHTVRLWYLPWAAYGRDLRLLIPHHHRKGNRRPRGLVSATDEPDPYKMMDAAIEIAYLRMPRKSKKFAYDLYVSMCLLRQLAPFSGTTFRKRIKDRHTDREEYAARYGKRAAYIKFGIFERTELPERPLEEVEVDHCLINLIVTDPKTGRAIGRPWLTALLDRATRVILGVHLSFESPSYAALQRALAHAIWPKDLSGVTGLLDDWPCYGIMVLLICDNGKEFRSRSLRASESLLGFKVVNLPVKSPWLKGAVERLFRTIDVQVFSWQDGSTVSRSPDFYDPVGRATRTLSQVREMLLRWIVNDYHRSRHGTLGCAPIEKWRELTSKYPVRVVPDFDHVIRLTGDVIKRNISNVGIRNEGLLYADKQKLEKLLARRGGSNKDWLIRVDPYDQGEIWLLDEEAGEWLTIPCTNQAISRGVSKFQHRVHCMTAGRNLPRGTSITEDDILQAKQLCEAALRELNGSGRKTSQMTRAARYASCGEYFTPLIGAPAPRILDEGAGLVVPQQSHVASTTNPVLPDLTREVEEMAELWSREARQNGLA